MASGNKIKCILLESNPNNWFTDVLFACDRLEIFAAEKNRFLSNPPNPYQLSATNKADVVFISTNCFDWLKKENIPVSSLCSELRKVTSKIIGIEGNASFSLGLPPEFFNEIDALLKAQGVFKDKELYNYLVGTQNPEFVWDKKVTKLPYTYSNEELDKIKLSYPCMLATHPEVRKKVRKARPGINYLARKIRNTGDALLKPKTGIANPKHTAHFVGALTHILRLKLVNLLKQNNISGIYGITGIPEEVWGTNYGCVALPKQQLNQIAEELKRNNAIVQKMNRIRYKKTMLNHKIVLAPCGYGELSFRMAEGWELGLAVLSQNISHVETLYPFKQNENIIFCAPDLNDLISILKQIEHNEIDYQKIAKQGKADWGKWISNWESIMEQAVIQHL